MRQYVFKRLLLVVPTLLLVSIIVFSLTRLIPGDVVVLMFEEKAYAEDLEALRAKLGLNQPIYVQYGIWLSQVVRGNLGESLWTKRPVLEEITPFTPAAQALREFPGEYFGVELESTYRAATERVSQELVDTIRTYRNSNAQPPAVPASPGGNTP